MIQPEQETKSCRLTAADVEHHGEMRALPATIGDCHSHFSPIAKGFTVVSSDYQPMQALIEETHHLPSCPMLVMTFGLTGHSAFHSDDGTAITFNEGLLTVSSFCGSQGERHYRAGEQVRQLRLLLSAERVSQYFGQATCQRLFATDRVRVHHSRPYGQATLVQLEQLRQAHHDPLMWQIHALNLLAQQRDLMEPQRKKRLHPQDELRLEQARDWMQAHLAYAFSLSTLAVAVGLSEYKLKQGFRLRFNTTPGQMLLQLRMEKAHQLLEQGYQVAQAGWQVGFRHANNFSVAFYRYFGRQASTVMGKKQ